MVRVHHAVDVLVPTIYIAPRMHCLDGFHDDVRVCDKLIVYPDTTLLRTPDSVEMRLQNVTHASASQR
jgi:hypothetical protein